MVTVHTLSAGWQLRIVIGLLLACGWGHLDYRVERWRFARRRRRLGYRTHGEYVAGPKWDARRHRFLTETRPEGCRACGRRRRRGWHVHHKDYSRAGAGGELDRDLMLVCPPCHSLIHSWYRPRGGLRRAGVTLRACTWLVIGALAVPRWLRRLRRVGRREIVVRW